MSWRYYYNRTQNLERQNTRLSNQNNELSRQVSTLRYNVRELQSQNTRLSNRNRELSSQVSTLGYKVWELESEKTRLYNKNRELSSQVSTLGYKVRELEHQNTKLSGELVKQREDTRKAGLLFMNAADTYQEVAKKKIRAEVEELANTRKAGLLLMNNADTYQEVARKQIKAKTEELEDTRKAVLVLMSAADTYQQEAKKRINDKVEELKILGGQKADLDARAASLESGLKAALAKNQELEVDYDKVKVENDKLQSEVERLKMDLATLADAEEAAAKTFDDEKAEIMKEFEDLNTKDEEIQASKDLMNCGNNKLRSDVLTAEQKHSLFEAEVERLNMELGALAEVKEAENMKEAEV